MLSKIYNHIPKDDLSNLELTLTQKGNVCKLVIKTRNAHVTFNVYANLDITVYGYLGFDNQPYIFKNNSKTLRLLEGHLINAKDFDMDNIHAKYIVKQALQAISQICKSSIY